MHKKSCIDVALKVFHLLFSKIEFKFNYRQASDFTFQWQWQYSTHKKMNEYLSNDNIGFRRHSRQEVH